MAQPPRIVISTISSTVKWLQAIPTEKHEARYFLQSEDTTYKKSEDWLGSEGPQYPKETAVPSEAAPILMANLIKSSQLNGIIVSAPESCGP